MKRYYAKRTKPNDTKAKRSIGLVAVYLNVGAASQGVNSNKATNLDEMVRPIRRSVPFFKAA